MPKKKEKSYVVLTLTKDDIRDELKKFTHKPLTKFEKERIDNYTDEEMEQLVANIYEVIMNFDLYREQIRVFLEHNLYQ